MITDLAPYRKYIDQFDLTEEQKLDLVNALWTIVDNIYDQCLGANQLVYRGKLSKKTVDKEVQPVSIEDVTHCSL